MRALGLMSGTSLDGIDAALIDVSPRDAGYALELIRGACIPFEASLEQRLRAALPPGTCTPDDVCALDVALGDAFAAAARSIVGDDGVDFAASHGLTLSHRGDEARTLQIGDPYRLRDALSATVVFDFRRADCARGGAGAPLVPYVDARLFASGERDVVALNLGGIANVTVLERGAPPEAARAWDTGPANMLLDAFVQRRTIGGQRCDRDGAYAEAGTPNERVVRELVAREAFYLVQPPPKSTGRERFGAALLDAQADLFATLTLEDGCATLADFTAVTLADTLAGYGPASALVVASGGGVHNRALVARIRTRLHAIGYEFCTSDALGVDPDLKEAIAFAVLGYETLRERPASVPAATGASAPAVLGALAPHRLRALLERVRAEAVEAERGA